MLSAQRLSSTNSHGFTLVEILIVIAIIGILSSLLLPNFLGARERARDARRKSDIDAIRKGLELFKNDQSPVAYPTATSGRLPCAVPLPTTGASMGKVPCDPLGPTPYIYTSPVGSSNLDYTLTACLENAADPDRDTPATLANCTYASYTKAQP